MFAVGGKALNPRVSQFVNYFEPSKAGLAGAGG